MKCDFDLIIGFEKEVLKDLFCILMHYIGKRGTSAIS